MAKNIEMQVLSGSSYEAIYPVPANHKNSHKTGGSDAISPSDIGAVPTSRTVNGKALSANITLSASDVSAYSKSETNTLLANKASTIKKTTVTLSTSWSGSSSPYTQTVTISGITANSKVDLQPDAAVIQQMVDDEVVAMNIVNNNGVLTAYAVGEKPTAQMVV